MGQIIDGKSDSDRIIEKLDTLANSSNRIPVLKKKEEKVCFVISPIGKAGSDERRCSDLTFNYIIKPVVEKFGYRPIRADHINESGMITYQIIDYIIDSSLVIADLTNNNPNVYYELAIRHIVEKPYIQMIKSDQKIPFDVKDMRTIPFDIDVEQADNAKQELTKQIDLIETEFNPVNPYTLATNYSTVQKILKERGNTEPNDITDIVLKSVNELRSMMDNMREDIHNLEASNISSRSRQFNIRKSINDIDQQNIYSYRIEKVLELHNMFKKYNEIQDDGNIDVDIKNNLLKQIAALKDEISQIDRDIER